jgi:small nuclear ribonucleoprotein D3
LKSGETYRGQLVEAEDNWNCQLSSVSFTGKDGKQQSMENAYLRGSKIRMVIVPDMLKNAPMFKKIDPRTPKILAGTK